MPQKLTGHEEVADFLQNLEHPLKNALLRIREIILGAEDSITEHVKWKAPSFVHSGDDRITFNLHRSGKVLLIFHRGAKVKDARGGKKLIDDTTGLLNWITDDRASIEVRDLSNVEAIAGDLQKVVKRWLSAASNG